MRLTLDAIDLRILEILQQDAGLPNTDLAEKVGLSPAPCWRRVKRLEDAGVIARKVAILDPDAVGLPIIVFSSVKLTSHGDDALAQFETAVMAYPEVTECYTVSGAMDFLLRVVTTSMRAYENFLRERVLKLPGVSEVHSRFVVTQVKYTTAIPVRKAIEEQQ